jgi:lysozyme family protein
MADLNAAMKLLFKDEGGFVDNPEDPGGPTNYGISARFLTDAHLFQYDRNGNGIIDAEDMKELSINDAKTIYRTYWWDLYGYDRIENEHIATKLLDEAVNLGQISAVRQMQRAINVLAKSEELIEDGKMGLKTIDAINQTNSLNLLEAFETVCAKYYDKLIANNPNLKVFSKGWHTRVFDDDV